MAVDAHIRQPGRMRLVGMGIDDHGAGRLGRAGDQGRARRVGGKGGAGGQKRSGQQDGGDAHDGVPFRRAEFNRKGKAASRRGCISFFCEMPSPHGLINGAISPVALRHAREGHEEFQCC